MARPRTKSWQDIANQRDRILSRLGVSRTEAKGFGRRVYSTDNNFLRARRVADIADRYQENILSTKRDKQGVARYDALMEKAMRADGTVREDVARQAFAQAEKNGTTQYSRSTYMGLS